MANYMVAYSINIPRTYAKISKVIAEMCTSYVNIFEPHVWFVTYPSEPEELFLALKSCLEESEELTLVELGKNAHWHGELVSQDCPNWFTQKPTNKTSLQ